MFRKICFFMTFFGFLGLAYGEEAGPQQLVTSEVFYDSGSEEYVNTVEEYVEQEPVYEPQYVEPVQDVPVWPEPGSEADFEIACSEDGCAEAGTKIVSKVGSGLIIENNIATKGTGWSGGPNITNGALIAAGFDYECANDAEMPLLRREMMEDDGSTVLSVSRSPRRNCNKQGDSYVDFVNRSGKKTCNSGAASSDTVVSVNGGADGAVEANTSNVNNVNISINVNNQYNDAEATQGSLNQVRSWVVVDGQTLRSVLKSWCDKEGWDLVWTTSREYPIEASAVFKGRFIDVASALVRNFERATPVPYAKFYKGNRVVVVSTTEE